MVNDVGATKTKGSDWIRRQYRQLRNILYTHGQTKRLCVGSSPIMATWWTVPCAI